MKIWVEIPLLLIQQRLAGPHDEGNFFHSSCRNSVKQGWEILNVIFFPLSFAHSEFRFDKKDKNNNRKTYYYIYCPFRS